MSGTKQTKSRVRYHQQTGVARRDHRLRLLAWPALVVMLIAGYWSLNVLAPTLPNTFGNESATADKLTATHPQIQQDRLYIPKINVDVAIVPQGNNVWRALEKGAVHRAPQNGDPKTGGNFVLAAHRFNLGFTPIQTRARSPFYHIDQLAVNDKLYIDYAGTRYVYSVVQYKSVKPTAIEIEDRTAKPQLTLYTCELSGPQNGREVIVAKPVGKVVWSGGQQQLQAL